MSAKALVMFLGSGAVLATFATGAFSGPTHATGTGEAREVCPSAEYREFPIADSFSSDRYARADLASICINRGDRVARLFYRASAMTNASLPGYASAPWVHLRFFDGSGRLLFTIDNVDVATVSSCGGYQRHANVPVKNISLYTNDELGRVQRVEAWMGGTDRVKCR